MAEKISMIIVVVDLDCYKCYNKMRKILCKLQDHERIRTISFDDKSKTITIVGPFDPQRLACKIRCKGGKVVKDVHIVDIAGGKPPPQMIAAEQPPPPPSAPVNNGKKKNKEKPPPPEPPPPAPTPPPPEPAPPPHPPPPAEMPPPSPVHQLPPPDREMTVAMPAFIEEKKPNRARQAELEPPMSPPHKERPPMDMPMPAMHLPPKERPPPPPCRPAEHPNPVVEYVPPTVEIPSWPAPPVGPCGCPCCAPCYQGYYEGCRCCCCGRAYSHSVSVQPLLPAAGGCRYRGCRTFCDDDPSAACSIM